MKKKDRFFNVIDSITEKIGMAISFLVLLIIVMLIYEVISRYVFNDPTIWAWPLTKLALMVFALVGGSYTLRHKKHIRIEVLYERFGSRMKFVSRVISALAFIIFLGAMLWQSYSMAATSTMVNEYTVGMFRVPLYPFKIAMPLATLLFLIQGIAYFGRDETKYADIEEKLF